MLKNKEIICVYQDCPLCGDRGKKLKKIIVDKNIDLRKVSFASPEGRELCFKAVTEFKIKTMPFFTDGKDFNNNINELLKPKVVKKTRKRAKKTIEKGGENGSDS